MCSLVGDDLPSIRQDLGSTSSTTYISKSMQGGPVLTSALCHMTAFSIQGHTAILLMRKQILRDTKKLSSFSLVWESAGTGRLCSFWCLRDLSQGPCKFLSDLWRILGLNHSQKFLGRARRQPFQALSSLPVLEVIWPEFPWAAGQGQEARVFPLCSRQVAQLAKQV